MLVRLTAIVAFMILVAPLTVDAQPSGQPVHTVGVLMPQNVNVYPSYAAFPETLRQLGYYEGKNLRIVLRSAEGKLDRLPTLATELVSTRVDVIVAVNTPGARAAIQATKQIPIVMTEVGDPIGTGFVSNLARPGGNVTGISTMVGELTAKRLAILKEVVPSAKRLAMMFNPDDPVTVPQMRDAERAAPLLNVEIRRFPVRATANLPETFKDMLAWRADAALWLFGQIQAFQARTIELAARHRLAVMVGIRQDVEAGGFISYCPDFVELHKRTAIYVDRILRGAKPGDLPVEQPTKFDLVINLRTAKALDLTIPSSLRLQADRVVE
jgi:putative tryptophan/tyrosine transport system substrate-binding protein